MIAPTITDSVPVETGYWRIIVDPKPSNLTSTPIDVTFVRGAATTVSSLTTTDPFGPAAATLVFTSVTLLDTPGAGDLSWLVPEANVDICWMKPQINVASATVWSPANAYLTGALVKYGNQYYTAKSSVGPFPAWSLWSSYDNYYVGDKFLSPDGNVYVCILDRTAINTQPQSDPTHWQLFNWQPNADTTHWTSNGSADQTDADVIYRWEGYFASFEYGEEDAGSTLTVQCKGAMLQMDNYLAYPEHLTQPLSYEFAIERQFGTVNRPDSRLRDCVPFKETAKTDPDFAFLASNEFNVFNSANYTNFNSKDAIYNKTMSKFYKPINLKDGDLWTGLLTRSTGNFEPVLTNYIQNLLESMQTPTGSFTLLLAPGRKPYFKHRKRLSVPASDTLVVDILWPGVKVSVTQDFTQKVNVVYGSGKALNGDTFTNIVYDNDGGHSRYAPFAYKQENYPRVITNASYNQDKMSKEVSLNFWAGLSPTDAKVVAEKHLELFSDPGITANLTLNTDPQLSDGTGVARQTITAGSTVLLKGLFGNQQGILFHVTDHSYSADGNTVSLTLDSKYRSQLTVQEVRARGKDSMVISRLLGVGQFKPNIDDMLFPWSYEQGSGFVPTGSRLMWDLANRSNLAIGDFPWTNLTTSFPPNSFNSSKKNDSATHYVGITGAADTENANNNWSGIAPVMFSAAGTISAVRFAAVKADGTPYRVPFHVSLWIEDGGGGSGLSYLATPRLADPTTFGIQARTLTAKAVNQSGASLSGNLTVSKTLNTGSNTVTATLRFSSKSADYIFDRITGAGKIQIRDMKTISKSYNKWFVIDTYDKTNKTVTFKVSKALAKAFTAGANTKETVKNIWFLASYSPSPADAGIIPAMFNYKWGQNYPFFQRAWERIEPEGNVPTDEAFYGPNTPIAGWGTFYEMAGFYPNSGGILQYAPATGLFSDDTPFSYDFMSGTQITNVSNQDPPSANTLPASDGTYSGEAKKRASGSVMFYCDSEYDETTGTLVPRKESVYFIGRLYRQNPGGD